MIRFSSLMWGAGIELILFAFLPNPLFSGPSTLFRARSPPHQLAFYGSYHATKWNKIIHLICIPQIAW